MAPYSFHITQYHSIFIPYRFRFFRKICDSRFRLNAPYGLARSPATTVA